MVYLVENLHRFVELYIPQEGGQVLEQVDQQLSIHGPTLEDKEIQLRLPLCVGLIQLTSVGVAGWWRVCGPHLLLRRVRQHPRNEDTVGDELQPGINKARCFGGPQDVESVTGGRESRVRNTKDTIGSIGIEALGAHRAVGGVLPEGREGLEVDGFQDVFRGVELQQ